MVRGSTKEEGLSEHKPWRNLTLLVSQIKFCCNQVFDRCKSRQFKPGFALGGYDGKTESKEVTTGSFSLINSICSSDPIILKA